MPRLKELLSSPLSDTVIRKPVISPVASNSIPKIDSQSMANSILSSKPELATFGEGKLSQLIETLFNESEIPNQPTQRTNPNPAGNISQMKIPAASQNIPPQNIPSQNLNRTPPVLQQRPAASMQNTVLRPPPMLKPKPDQSGLPPTQNQPGFPPTQNLNAFPPTQNQAGMPPMQNQSGLPPTQNQRGIPPTQNFQPTSAQNSTQIPQNDGIDDTDEDDDNDDDSLDEDFSEEENVAKVKKPRKKYEKRTKIPIESVFEDIEKLYIKRGRARPDHNDQAHHWKSKWAQGVAPEDVYIAQGGLAINSIGIIHPETNQRFKHALCPEGYQATRLLK